MREVLLSWSSRNPDRCLLDTGDGLRPTGLAATASPWQAGWLFNRRALASRLALPADSDESSVVVHSYRRHGAEATARSVEGCLAWLLWDDERRQWVAAVDRIGELELFFAYGNGDLHLSTDPYRLAGLLGARRPDLDTAARHVVGRPPRPGRSPFAGVSAVRPGHLWRAGPAGVTQAPYWHLRPGSVRAGSAREVARQIRETVVAVARDHASRGSPGIALSAGCDSTAVAAAMHLARPGASIPCFTWSAPDLPEADEAPCARQVADGLGFPWHRIDGPASWIRHGSMPLSAPQSAERLPFAEPWADTLTAARRLGLDSILTGSGGDHLFLGAHSATGLDLLMEGRARRFVEAWRDWRSAGRSLLSIFRGEVWKPLRWITFPPRRGRDFRRSWLRAKWRRGAFRNSRPGLAPWHSPARRLLIASLTDGSISGPVACLRRLGAKHDIEVRHPFFDHRVLELVASLPSWELRRDPSMKGALKAAFASELPPCVLERERKVVLMPMLDRSLRSSVLPRIEPLLRDMRAAELGLVDEGRLRRAVEGYRQGARYCGFWETVTLEDWLRRCF